MKSNNSSSNLNVSKKKHEKDILEEKDENKKFISPKLGIPRKQEFLVAIKDEFDNSIAMTLKKWMGEGEYDLDILESLSEEELIVEFSDYKELTKEVAASVYKHLHRKNPEIDILQKGAEKYEYFHKHSKLLKKDYEKEYINKGQLHDLWYADNEIGNKRKKDDGALGDLQKLLVLGYLLDSELGINRSVVSCLVDHYTRNYINHYLNSDHETNLEFKDWAKMFSNFSKSSYQTNLHMGTQEFLKRLYHPFKFKQSDLIDDCLDNYAKTTVQVFDFISYLSTEYKTPLQVDVCIIPKDIEWEESELNYKKQEGTFENIDSLLKQNEYKYVSGLFSLNMKPKELQRCFKEVFSKLLEDCKLTKSKELVRKRRFNIIIDRRRSNEEEKKDNDKKDNNFFMFVPIKKGTDRLGRHVPETYFELSKSFVVDYRKNKQGDEYGAKSDYPKLFFLNFHLFNKDFVKIYLNHKSRMCRMFPKDVIKVWPYLFKKNGNELQKVSKKNEKDLNNPKFQWKDKILDKLLENYKMKQSE